MAALITLLLVLLLVIMPVAFISGSLVREGANLYQSIKSGQLNFGAYFQQAMEALPPSVHDLLARFDLADIPSLQEKLSAGAMQVSQFLATQALSIGQDTFQFVISFGIMLYLLFFLLRDGPRLSARISRAIPLSETHKHHLLLVHHRGARDRQGQHRRGRVAGCVGRDHVLDPGHPGRHAVGRDHGLPVAAAGGGRGPDLGAGGDLFPLTGATVKGVVLILFGVLVIGMVDNILRPVLVGKDTKMPDYAVLISTLGAWPCSA